MKKFFLFTAAFIFLAAGCGKQIETKPEVQKIEKQYDAPAPEANLSVPAQKNFKVYQSVEGSGIYKPSYSVAENQNALELLKNSHVVETKSYGQMGEFVLSIDGIKPDNQHFWQLYVNGKSSSVGAGSYVLKEGDKVEWKLSEIKSY